MTTRRPPYCLLLVAMIAAGALGGCTHLRLDPSYAGPTPRDAAFMRPFEYERRAVPVDETVIGEHADRTVRRIEFDAAVTVVDAHRIVLDWHHPAGVERAPVILVLPILGGDNEFARHFAASFARRGFAAIIVHRQEQYKDADDLDELNRTFRQVVLDHRQAIDWIETRPELDAERLGIFGISAGSIHATLVAGVDDRIDAAVLALAGGDVPSILARSPERGIAKRRRRALADSGLTVDELEDLLRDGFEHDPLVHAPYIDARDVLLVVALFDRAVPYRNGMALRDAMGGPRTVLLPTGHYTAIVYVPYLEGLSADFFREKLAPSSR